LPIETKKLDKLLKEITAKTHTFDSAGLDKIDDHLMKYDDLLIKESDINDELTEVRSSANLVESELITHHQTLDESIAILSELKKKLKISNKFKGKQQAVEQLHKLNGEINSSDAQRISMATELGRLTERLMYLHAERNEYKKLSSEWEVYDTLLRALSKRGLPNQMLKQLAPVINSEVSRILHGVAGFTVRIETNLDKNAMDIIIDYGDSHRVIELASGMEKMISSLALRVALINISSLPKTDMFIIDEGFGALDESNVEACNRMLVSLKRWFKNIIVITHVDAVKDVVDNVLEITRDGVDSHVIHK
jgi:DNA repair exonuclease SbcCD ATPase subunit